LRNIKPLTLKRYDLNTSSVGIKYLGQFIYIPMMFHIFFLNLLDKNIIISIQKHVLKSHKLYYNPNKGIMYYWT